MAKLKLKIPDYPKFGTDNWKILLIDNGLSLYGEWEKAFSENGMQVLNFPIRYYDCAVPNYYRQLTAALDSFRPDLVFNINFIGFDIEGRLSALFAALNIPVIFWLIDHPFRFFPRFSGCVNEKNKLMVIDRLWQKLIEKEFEIQSEYMPLAVTDYYSSMEFSDEPKSQISYISQTGIDEIAEFNQYRLDLDAETADDILLKTATQVSKQPDRDFQEILAETAQNKNIEISFQSDDQRRGYQLSVLAMADFLYRKKHINLLTKLDAEILGDLRWSQFFPEYPLIKPYPGLSEKYNLYHNSEINIHLSSSFLPGTFNRNFLEIPLCGGFVITDYRAEYEEFYQKDVYKYFNTVSELAKTIDFYLTHPKQRIKQLDYTINYILTNHLYKNRVEFLRNFVNLNLRVSS